MGVGRGVGGWTCEHQNEGVSIFVCDYPWRHVGNRWGGGTVRHEIPPLVSVAS